MKMYIAKRLEDNKNSNLMGNLYSSMISIQEDNGRLKKETYIVTEIDRAKQKTKTSQYIATKPLQFIEVKA